MSAPTYGAIIGTFTSEPHAVPGSGSEFTAPFRFDDFDTTELNVAWRIIRPAVLRNFAVEVIGTQPNDGDLVITVRWADGDTSIVVTIPAGTTTTTGLMFNDSENIQDSSTGERISFFCDNQSESPSIGIRSMSIGADQPLPG